MIKNKILMVSGLFFLVALTLSSCRKDLGNYNYHDINNAAITNIDESYTSLTGQALVIKPTLKFTKDESNDTTKYRYQWFVLADSSGYVVKKNIGKYRDLIWQVSLPSLNRKYQAFYQVTEKSTGLSWRKSFDLWVNTNISDGWLVLSEVNEKSRLDFYNYITADGSFQYYTDILTTMTNLALKGKPKLLYFCNRRDPFSSVIARSIFVGTDQESFIVNTGNNTFNTYVTLASTINGYSPPPYYAQKVINQGSYLTYLLDSQGQLFFENATQNASFGVRVNRLSNGELIKMSPYFSAPLGGVGAYAVIYDVDKKRFLEHKGISTASAVPATSSTLFDPGNIGMELLYMEASNALSGQTFAIFKNNDGKIFLARIVCSASSFNPVAFDEITTAPEMSGASQFAVDPAEGYIMYLVGSKVYRFNPFDKSNSMVVDLGSRKVSLMKYQKMVYNPSNVRYAEYAKKLIICTYDEANPTASGKMELFNVPNLNGAVTPYKTFDGFGKIVAVSYRE
uniref:PKD-like family lipoprotein n=1 Tax=Pedobacter schmidteae TaxID=2201271 RepID=UPI0013CED7A0|nr:PKD-like family lipoprotein [Pedobacter schmidteae]